MKSKPKKEYEVGYGKPPVATRFKEGQSGNPNGWTPKKVAQELDPGKILQSIDNEGIVVNINGKRKRMPKAEIYFQQLFTKAIKEDLTAGGVRPGTAASDQERAVQINAAGDDRGSNALWHQAALSGDHSLVGVGFSLHHRSIKGNAFPWPHPHQRADGNLPHRMSRLHAAFDHGRARERPAASR